MQNHPTITQESPKNHPSLSGNYLQGNSVQKACQKGGMKGSETENRDESLASCFCGR